MKDYKSRDDLLREGHSLIESIRDFFCGNVSRDDPELRNLKKHLFKWFSDADLYLASMPWYQREYLNPILLRALAPMVSESTQVFGNVDLFARYMELAFDRLRTGPETIPSKSLPPDLIVSARSRSAQLWEEFHEAFRDLWAEEQAFIENRRWNPLTALGNYNTLFEEPGIWSLFEGTGEIQAQFITEVKRAGRVFEPWRDENVINYWLHRLSLYSPENAKHYVVGGPNDTHRMIDNVCGASAHFCGLLKELAMEGGAAHKAAAPAQIVNIPKSDLSDGQLLARLPDAKARRDATAAYIEEVRQKNGKRITQKDIYEAAGYKNRSSFDRWKRDSDRTDDAAAIAFTRVILFEKPHLK